MQTTTNYALKKPEATDYYNIEDFNENAEVIDAKLKELEDGKAEENHTHTQYASTEHEHSEYATNEFVSETYQQSTGYTDQKIADLINGAPETLDTLKEIADAMAENEDVVDALDSAIGTKANQSELDTHTGNSTVHITSLEREAWNNNLPLSGGTMEDGAEIIMPVGGIYNKGLKISSRANPGYDEMITSIFSGWGMRITEADTLPWMNGINYNNSEGNFLGGIGAYGVGGNLKHFGVGGDIADPLLKIEPDGNTTAKGDILATDENGNRASLLGIFSKLTTVQPLISDVATLISGGYVQIGNIVIVNAQILLTADIEPNVTSIVKNLPISSTKHYALLRIINGGRGSFFDAYTVGMNLRIITTDTASIASGQYLTISGAYTSEYSNL